MKEEQLKTLEDLRDEIPGFAPSTRKALDDAISELRFCREMMEKAGRIELNGDGCDDHGTIERDWDEDSNFWIIERFGHDS